MKKKRIIQDIFKEFYKNRFAAHPNKFIMALSIEYVPCYIIEYNQALTTLIPPSFYMIH